MSKELSHIEDLIVIYGTLPTGANRTRIMQLIDTYTAQVDRDARVDELDNFPEYASRYAFQPYSLTVDYVDGTNSGVLPARKWMDEAYKKFTIARTQRIKELQATNTKPDTEYKSL